MTRPEAVTAAQICDQGTNLDGCQAGALDRRSAMPCASPASPRSRSWTGRRGALLGRRDRILPLPNQPATAASCWHRSAANRRPLPRWTMRSHLVGSGRLLHPPGVAEGGRGQDRVVVATATAAGAPPIGKRQRAPGRCGACSVSSAAALSKRPCHTTRRPEQSSAPATSRCRSRPRARVIERGAGRSVSCSGRPAAGECLGDQATARSTGIDPSADRGRIPASSCPREESALPATSSKRVARGHAAAGSPHTVQVAHRLGPYGSPPHILHMTVPATGSIRRRLIGTHAPHSQTGPRAAAAAARSCGPACPASAADSSPRAVSYS